MMHRWSALARQRFKAERTEFKSGITRSEPEHAQGNLPHSKGLLLPMLVTLCVSTTSFAEDLSQLYEKAYFLETAKGQTAEALTIYREIAATEATDENRGTITQALKRLLESYYLGGLPNDTRDEQFKKAFLLKRSGHYQQAILILEKLSTISNDRVEPNTEEHTFHSKVLASLLEIAVTENDPKNIAIYQKRLLHETDETIHSLINKMPAGGTVYLPEGTYSGNKLAYHSNRNIWVAKEITLKGANRDRCIIEGTMDLPIIHANLGSKLTLDSITLKSQLLTYGADESFPDIGCALKTDDNSKVVLTNCNITATGTIVRSPLAIHTEGFSEATLIDCRITGFAVPIFFGDGSSGNIKHCILQNQLTTMPNTNVRIENTIFHDSNYDAIDCNGGILALENCLIINAAGSALDISSGTDKFSMSNSAVVNCGEIVRRSRVGVSREGTVTLKNNIFVFNNLTSGTSYNARVPTSKRILLNNIFYGNTAENWGDTLLADKTDDGSNTFWNNKGLTQAVTNQNLVVGEMLNEDPQFIDPESGGFTPANPHMIQASHGLSDPVAIAALWQKYTETCK